MRLAHLGILLLGCALLPVRAEDHQLWSSLSATVWRRERISLGLYAEARLRDDISEPYGYYIGPKLSYKLLSGLTAATSLKYIQNKSGEHFEELHRLEVELERTVTIAGYRWRWRERVETIDRDGRATRTRFRHLLACARPTGQPVLTRVAAQAELFNEDGPSWRISQTRITPLQFTFAASPRVNLDLGYMLLSTKSRGDWDRAHVLQFGFRIGP